MGVYKDLYDFANSNFKFSLNENREIEVISSHFEMYMSKKIVSTVSYGKEFHDAETIRDYIRTYLIKDIKRYDILVFNQMQKL